MPPAGLNALELHLGTCMFSLEHIVAKLEVKGEVHRKRYIWYHKHILQHFSDDNMNWLHLCFRFTVWASLLPVPSHNAVGTTLPGVLVYPAINSPNPRVFGLLLKDTVERHNCLINFSKHNTSIAVSEKGRLCAEQCLGAQFHPSFLKRKMHLVQWYKSQWIWIGVQP